MKFKKSTAIEPDINLIPFIDVLLVVLIFLMLTTTWSRFNQMNVSLPSAAAQGSTEDTPSWVVVVSSQGTHDGNRPKIEGRTLHDLSAASAGLRKTDAALIIKADASASHQSVVNVLEAARMNGVVKIAFATQSSSQANKP